MKSTFARIALLTATLATLMSCEIQAAPLVSTLNTGQMSATTFNSLFTPIAQAPAISASFQFMKTPVSGVMLSQVFQGTGTAAGLYAYAFQINVNPVSDSSGQPTSVNSASTQFNATPIATNLIDSTSANYSAYLIKDGAIGGIGASQAGPSGVIQGPSSIALTSGTSSKSLTFQFLNPNVGAGPLEAGAKSATVVVLSDRPFTTYPVSIQNANPQIAYPIAYSPSQVSVPEPSTLFGWAVVAGGAGLLRRRAYRRRERFSRA